MNEETIKKYSNSLILIKKYALAATNLYGAIKLDRFVQIINDYESSNLTKDNVEPILNYFTYVELFHFYYADEILTDGGPYEVGSFKHEYVEEILLKHTSHALYLPSRDEFLKYENKNYIEPRETYERLEAFIKSSNIAVNKTDRGIKRTLHTLHCNMVFNRDIKDNMKLFASSRGYDISDSKSIFKFWRHLENVSQHTRKHINCGYTDAEIKASISKDVKYN